MITEYENKNHRPDKKPDAAKELRNKLRDKINKCDDVNVLRRIEQIFTQQKIWYGKEY